MKNDTIVTAIVAAVAFIVILGALSFGGMMSFGGYNGMMGGYSCGGFMGIFGWLFMVLLVVALVFFILWLIKQLQGGKR